MKNLPAAKEEKKKKVSDELKEEGIDKKKFNKAYKAIKPLPRVHEKYTTVPGIKQEELRRIFDYMQRKGMLKKRVEEGVYDVEKEGIEIYEAQKRSEKLYAQAAQSGRKLHGE